MKVKDITNAINDAQYVIAELSRDKETYEKNVSKIYRIERLIQIVEEADIAIEYGDKK